MSVDVEESVLSFLNITEYFRWRGTNGTIVCLFGYGVVVTAVYVYTMYPGIPGGDSGRNIHTCLSRYI